MKPPVRTRKSKIPLSPGSPACEGGFILVTSLLILLILVVIGISATTNTTIELQIAGNEKTAKRVFYLADSGINIGPQLVSEAVDEGAPPSGTDLGSIRFAAGDNGTDFYRQIMGFDSYNGGKDNVSARELALDLIGDDDYGITLDVERSEAVYTPGSGVEFSTGTEGVGTGSSGGVAVNYRVESFGRGPGNASTSVEAGYRKIVGLAGGE